jgi:hypothetical protein
MKLFECTVFTFSTQILKVKVQHVTFNTVDEGEVSIFPGHENKKFVLSAGKILLQISESKTKAPISDISSNDIYTKDYIKIKDVSARSYYNGAGYAQMIDENLIIFGFPILQEFSYDQNIEKQLENLGSYGHELKAKWGI